MSWWKPRKRAAKPEINRAQIAEMTQWDYGLEDCYERHQRRREMNEPAAVNTPAADYAAMVEDLVPREPTVLEQFREHDYSKIFIRNTNGGWTIEHRFRISQPFVYPMGYDEPWPRDMFNFAPDVNAGVEFFACLPTWAAAMDYLRAHSDRVPAHAPVPLDSRVYQDYPW